MKSSGPQTRQSTRKKIKKSLGPDFLDPSSIGLHSGRTYIEEICELCKTPIASGKKEVTNCRKCGQAPAHNVCIRSRQKKRHTRDLWVCSDCKPCYRCDTTEKREGHIVFCMGCKAPYHLACALKYRFEKICVLCTYRPENKSLKNVSEEESDKAVKAEENSNASSGETEKAAKVSVTPMFSSTPSATTSVRHVSPKNKDSASVASTSKRGTRQSSDKASNKQSAIKYEPRKSTRSAVDTGESAFIQKLEADTEKDENDANFTKEENFDEEIAPLEEEDPMEICPEPASEAVASEINEEEASEMQNSQEENDGSKSQEVPLAKEEVHEMDPDPVPQASTDSPKTNEDQNNIDKPSETTENTSLNGNQSANGISSRIMKDANPNGAKKLKSILFERVCKIGGLLPAQTSEWTIEDVHDFVKFIGFPEEAASFSERQIDGKSLLLLTRDDVLTQFKLKLGPALKIYAHIFCLQRKKPSLLLGE